jgi:hypothetical protein
MFAKTFGDSFYENLFIFLPKYFKLILQVVVSTFMISLIKIRHYTSNPLLP